MSTNSRLVTLATAMAALDVQIHDLYQDRRRLQDEMKSLLDGPPSSPAPVPALEPRPTRRRRGRDRETPIFDRFLETLKFHKAHDGDSAVTLRFMAGLKLNESPIYKSGDVRRNLLRLSAFASNNRHKLYTAGVRIVHKPISDGSARTVQCFYMPPA